MIYFQLLFTFFKIGLFSFGGGYAMIPIIQKELEMNRWLSNSEFLDIVAISEMTPGPIAVNSATFVGYKVAGIFGGIIATIGVALPSLILVLIISGVFFRFQQHPLNKSIFYVIRPVVAGLIFSAAILVSETALFRGKLKWSTFSGLFQKPLEVINVASLGIFILSLVAIIRLKVHPILMIFCSGIIGIIIFSIFPL